MSSDRVVDEIKSRLDIVGLISEYVALKRSGRNYKGVCPFHAEKTPSFMVHPDKQIFHCFGCGAGGDAIGFVMKHEGLTFIEALRVLGKRVGVEVPNKHVDRKAEGLRDRLKAAMSEASKFFQSQLARSEPARAYLDRRGITEESREKFGVGYAPDSWHALLNHLKQKGFTEEHILKAGLATEGQRGPYDIFRGRIMFPILDVYSECIAFGGRIMGDGQPKYLNSPESELFKKSDTLYALSHARDAIRAEGKALIVEGYVDALMCHQYGVRNTVAPLGTALTAGHLKKLARQTEDIVLVFDGDAAGVAAARRSLALVLEQGMRSRVFVLPDGHDPDTLLREKGAEEFKRMMDSALTPVAFMLGPTADERAVNETVELIAKIDDPIARERHMVELADRARLGERAVREKLTRLRAPERATAPVRKPIVRLHNEETLILSALIADHTRAREAVDALGDAEFRNPLVRVLIARIADLNAPVGLDFGQTDEERSIVGRLTVEPGFEPDQLGHVIDTCISKILARRDEADIASLSAALRDAQSSGDREKQMALLARISERKKQSPQRSD